MNKSEVWARVDLDAIAHNTKELRKATDPKASLMVMVKADAYGHGALRVSRRALDSGADILGVARLGEALELRENGINAPILIMGYTHPGTAKTLIENGLMQSVFSLDSARALSQEACALGGKVKVHIKLDTGMGRLGIMPGNNSGLGHIESIARLPGLDVPGIFTHLASADALDKTFARKQLALFRESLGKLREQGLEFPVKHAANSAAIIDLPEAHMDMVRAGIALYGLYPSGEVNRKGVLLKPAMEMESKIIHLKKVPANFPISYGMTYTTKKATTIATVPVGYADGLSRLLSSRGSMLVRGKPAPIVGRVCMDITMLDVGDIPEARVGDRVTVFGEQNGASITVDQIAEKTGTINYEIVSTITKRVPRIYL